MMMRENYQATTTTKTMKLIPESEADKTKDVFVGMWRPPFPQIQKGYEGCTIGRTPWSEELRSAYLSGEFDSCLYKRVEPEQREWKKLGEPVVLPAWFWINIGNGVWGLAKGYDSIPSEYSHWMPFDEYVPSKPTT